MRKERIGTGQTSPTSPTLRGRANGEANNSSTRPLTTRLLTTRLLVYIHLICRLLTGHPYIFYPELSNYRFFYLLSNFQESENMKWQAISCFQPVRGWLFGCLGVWLFGRDSIATDGTLPDESDVAWAGRLENLTTRLLVYLFTRLLAHSSTRPLVYSSTSLYCVGEHP